MYKNEIKNAFKNINSNVVLIDNTMISIKTELHTLEKLGVNVNELYKQVDNLGIEIYKLKKENIEKFKEEDVK